MTSKKPFWDVEEKIGFVNIKAWDDLNYRVWNQGTPESLQQVANILADIRYDINRLLVCLYKNRNKWINWWIGRQVPKEDAVKKLIEIYDKHPVLKNQTVA